MERFEDFYNEYMDKLETVGVNDVIAEYQRQLDEWLAANKQGKGSCKGWLQGCPFFSFNRKVLYLNEKRNSGCGCILEFKISFQYNDYIVTVKVLNR